MINTEIGPGTTRVGELLRKQYKKGNLGGHEDIKLLSLPGIKLPHIPSRVALVVMAAAAFVVGNLPEFSIPGSASIKAHCFDSEGERRFVLDVRHLSSKIDKGELSLVYFGNPNNGDFKVAFPYENPEWRDLEADYGIQPPHRVIEPEALEPLLGAQLEVRQGFVDPQTIELGDRTGVLDSIRITEDCFERPQ